MTDLESQLLAEVPAVNVMYDALEALSILLRRYPSLTETDFTCRDGYTIKTEDRNLLIAFRILEQYPDILKNGASKKFEELFTLWGRRLHDYIMHDYIWENAEKRKELWERLAEKIRNGGQVPKEFGDRVYDFAVAVNPGLQGGKLKSLLEMKNKGISIKFDEDGAKRLVNMNCPKENKAYKIENCYCAHRRKDEASSKMCMVAGATKVADELSVDTVGQLQTIFNPLGNDQRTPRNMRVNLITGQYSEEGEEEEQKLTDEQLQTMDNDFAMAKWNAEELSKFAYEPCKTF